MFLRNVRIFQQVYTVLQPKILTLTSMCCILLSTLRADIRTELIMSDYVRLLGQY